MSDLSEREAVPGRPAGKATCSWIDRALLLALGWVYALEVLWVFSGWRPEALLAWLGNAPQALAMALAALIAANAAWRCRTAGQVRQMQAWAAFALGLALWSAGQAEYMALDVQGLPALFPGSSDFFYLSLPLLFLLGMLLLPRARLARRQALGFLLDVSIVMGTLGGVFWSQFMAAHLLAYQGRPLALAVAEAYPVSDLLLVAVLLVVVLWRPSGAAGAPLLPFSVGLGVFFAGDTWYAVQMGAGQAAEGQFGETLWTAAALLFGLAASAVQRPLSPAQRRLLGLVEWLQRGLSVLPYVSVTVVYLLLTVTTGHRNVRALGTLIAALGVTVLVLVRQFVALRENRQLTEQLKRDATHDALTGLMNRAALTQEVDAAIVRAQGSGELAALLFIDLDRFKSVNDLRGHQAGDGLLMAVAERLRVSVRRGDTLARLGGDEFVLLMEHLCVPEEAEHAAQLTVDALGWPFLVAGQEVEIGGSIGVTLLPRDAASAEKALRNADLAMYAAKAAGRSGYALFDSHLATLQRTRAQLATDLRAAASRGELSVAYQPQFSAAGELRGMEALLRWTHAEHGAVSPAQFIPMAEEGNFVHELGFWVMNAVLAQMQAWSDLLPGLSVSVNTSAMEFNRPQYVRQVRTLLARHSVPARHLTIELTESCVVDDAEAARSKLLELRAMGVRVSLDDFGTGYSSLSSLRALGADELKLDRSFLRDLTAGSASEAFFRAVVDIGHGLGLTVLAEGVETADQMRLVVDCGVDDVQGYLLGRPLPGPEMRALLIARAARCQVVDFGVAAPVVT